MGKPYAVNPRNPPQGGSEPAEVKHPSKRRKRKQLRHYVGNIPLVAASEKGKAQTCVLRLGEALNEKRKTKNEKPQRKIKKERVFSFYILDCRFYFFIFNFSFSDA